MRSSGLSAILSAVALVGVGVLFLRVERLAEQVRPLSQGRQNAVRIGVEESPGSKTALPPRASLPTGAGTQGTPAAASSAELEADAPALPVTLEERLARVEERQDRLERDGFPGLGPERIGRIPRFVGSVDELATTLNLTGAQRDRVADTFARGRRRVEEVLKIPDKDGKSPFERRQEQRAKMEESLKSGNPGGVLSYAFMGNSYRDSRIPGRNTTYGTEIDRITKETREEVAANLDPGQRETFEDIRIDPLLDENGPMTTFSVAVVSDRIETAGEDE